MKISIIVLCWNHLEDVTKPFIKSFLKNTSGSYELILVNNGSSDGTREYLDKLSDKHKDIIVYHAPHNLGFGGGNNKALEYRSKDSTHTLFMNNDVVFHMKDWCEKLERELEKNPKTLLGQQLVTHNSNTEFRNTPVPYLNGWCVCVPNEFIDKHGAFDEEFYMAYFEDVELSVRARANGYLTKEIDLGIEHLISKSSDQMDIPEKFKYNKYIYRNKMYEYEKGDNLRIVFMATGNYKFIDEDYEGKGVGGAEASLILLARELAKRGHVVDIYNDTETQGNFNGVNYINIENFSYNDYSDVFVLDRNSMPGLELVNAHTKIFWSCDQFTTNDWHEEIIPYVDATIAISEYHRKYIGGHYPFDPKAIHVLDLGVKPGDYDELPEKKSRKIIFCSVPRRGLDHLARAYPDIKKRVPDIELVITSDYRLWGSTEGNHEYRAKFASLPDVKFLGKVPREDLVREQLDSLVLAYPCDYDENFCISAMECIAAGAVPVTTTMGALETTVADSGILIREEPGTKKFNDLFVNKVCHLLENESERLALQEKGRKRALSKYSWDKLVENQWEPFFKEMYNKTKMKKNYCSDCKKSFKTSFDFFKHRSKKHVITAPTKKNAPDLKVRIKVTRRIELNVGGVSYNTNDSITIPQRQAGDIVRILTEAYGESVIDSVKILMRIDN